MQLKKICFLLTITAALSACAQKLDDYKISTYTPKKSDKETYKQADNYIRLGKKEGNDIMYKLANDGYKPALERYVYSGRKGNFDSDVCEISYLEFNGKWYAQPHWALTKLALQGDKPVIHKYWECVNTKNQIVFDNDLQRGLFLLEHLGNQGDLEAMNILFSHYASKEFDSSSRKTFSRNGVRMTSRSHRQFDAPKTSLADLNNLGNRNDKKAFSGGLKSRVKNLEKLKHWANQYYVQFKKSYLTSKETVYRRDHTLNFIKMGNILTKYYIYKDDYKNAESWLNKVIYVIENGGGSTKHRNTYYNETTIRKVLKSTQSMLK